MSIVIKIIVVWQIYSVYAEEAKMIKNAHCILQFGRVTAVCFALVFLKMRTVYSAKEIECCQLSHKSVTEVYLLWNNKPSATGLKVQEILAILQAGSSVFGNSSIRCECL